MKYFMTRGGMIRRAESKGALIWQEAHFPSCWGGFEDFEQWINSVQQMNLDDWDHFACIRGRISKFLPGISPTTLDEFKEDCEEAGFPYTEELNDEAHVVIYEDREGQLYRVTLDDEGVIDQIFYATKSNWKLRSAWKACTPKSRIVKTFLHNYDKIAQKKPFGQYMVF